MSYILKERARTVQRLIIGTYKTITAGFSLIELMIVIALIGILGAIIIPVVNKRPAKEQRELFIVRLNELVNLGQREALRTHATHQVTIDFQHRIITLEKTVAHGEKSVPLITTQHTSLIWPWQYEIKQAFIEGYEEKNVTQLWFFISPEGITQDIIINFTDTKDMKDDKAATIGLVLNPFYAQFKTYDTFQYP